GRPMFLIGTVPALLCLVIFKHLKEPERWQAMKRAAAEGKSQQKLGSLAELFGDARWRKRALVGLLLSSSGIIGLWAIGFYSFDLTRSVFRKTFEAEARAQGEAKKDLTFVTTIMAEDQRLAAKAELDDAANADMEQLGELLLNVLPEDLLNLEQKSSDVQPLFKTLVFLNKKKNLLLKEIADPLGKEPATPTMTKDHKILTELIQAAFVFTPETVLAVVEQQELAGG